MAKIARKRMKQFGDTGPSSDFGQIGSLAAGAAVTTKNIDTMQNLSQYLQGLASIVTTVGSQPQVAALEDINALFYLMAYQICYLMQAGVPEYQAATTYYIGSYVNVDGTLYKSLIDDNVGVTPGTDPASWLAVNSTMPAGYLRGGDFQNDTSDPLTDIAFPMTAAKDDTDSYSINAGVLVKAVDATWVEGTAQGGLDTGTIGASPCKVYMFAIGKSDDDTAGDYLMSKSRTAPTMTLPAADGYDIKRCLGWAIWDGTKFAKFRLRGKGATKTVWLFDGIKVVNGGASATFVDVDCSTYIDGTLCGMVNVNFTALSGAGAMGIHIRPNGSTEALGGANQIGYDSNAADNVRPNGHDWITLDANAIFEYGLTNPGTVDGWIRSYTIEV